MPRGGWLAVGALGVAALGPLVPGWAVLLVASASWLPVALALARPSGHRIVPGWSVRAAAALAAGATLLALRVAATPATQVPALAEARGSWTATVESLGSPRDGSQVATLRLDEPAVLVWSTLPRYPAVAPGDRVLVTGRVRPPPDDGFGDYLRRAGMAGSLGGDALSPVAAAGGGPVAAVRVGSGEALAAVLPEPEAGLAAGILVGLRERVDRDVATEFATAGISHIVAISGWNIAIVGATVAALTRRVSRRRRTLLTLAAIGAYTAFAGASPSVLRAAAMAGVVLVARETGRAGRAAAALGWAVVLLLLADPRLVSDPGFQLSTVATAGLLAWATPLTARLRAGVPQLPAWIAESLGVSLAAQAATLPIVALAFGRLSLVAPLVNLVVVPLVPPAMAAGGAALAAGWLVQLGLPSAVGVAAALPAWAILAVIVAVARVAAGLPYASLALPPPAAAAVAASTLVVAGVWWWRRHPPGRGGWVAAPGAARPAVRGPRRASHEPEGVPRAASRFGSRTSDTPWAPAVAGTAAGARRRRPAGRAERVIAGALAAALVTLVLVAAARPDGRVHLTVLDVGQGDAILVEGDAGSRLLVDGGPDPDRLLVALDARLPPWDRRIDVVVLTHPHEDHVAGLPLLLERYRVGRIIEPGMRGPGPGYRAFQVWLALEGRRTDRLVTGDRLSVDGIALRVLWPDAGRVPADPPDTGTGINNVSIVLLGTFGAQRFLLAGDIEEEVDPELVARSLPRVDVLKVAHHGSRTASTDPFLDAVAARVAIVSAGEGNPYGHPARTTLTRLEAHGARVFRTDRDGSVEVTLDGRTLTVSAEGRAAAAEPGSATAFAATSGSAAVPTAPTVRASATARAATPAWAAVPATAVPARFACAIPSALAPGATSAGSTRTSTRFATVASAEGVGRADSAAPSTRAGAGIVASASLLYHRDDVGPRAGRSRQPPPPPGPAPLVPPPRASGRRGRCLARAPGGRSGGRARQARGRGGGAAPRRRQAAPRPRSRPPPAARRGLRAVAPRARPPGARPARRRSSGDPSRG